MKEYKSSLFVIGKNIVYGIGGAFVAALVASWFLSGFLAVLIGLAAGAAIIYFAVIGDNITVTLDDATMSVHRLGKLLHTFNREECSFHAKVVTTTDVTSDSDCTLTVTDADGEETALDCSMLGKTTFMRLLDDLGFNDQPAVAVATTKASE